MEGAITRANRRTDGQGDQRASGDLSGVDTERQEWGETGGVGGGDLVTTAFRAKTTKDRQTGDRGGSPDNLNKRGRSESEEGVSDSDGEVPACKIRKGDRALARSGKRKQGTPSPEEKQSKTQRRGGGVTRSAHANRVVLTFGLVDFAGGP